jgi:hypothetical protein
MQCWWVFKGWIIDFMYKIINNEVVYIKKEREI